MSLSEYLFQFISQDVDATLLFVRPSIVVHNLHPPLMEFRLCDHFCPCLDADCMRRADGLIYFGPSQLKCRFLFVLCTHVDVPVSTPDSI